jgi:serine protease Do
MLRRLALSVMLIVAGFVAGLVITGRMRTAADSSAAERPPAPAGAPEPRVPAAPAPALAQTPGSGVAPSGGGPDFTRVAGQAIKGVANISSLQVVSTRNTPFPNDPFFRYFFNGDDEVFGGRDRRSMSLGSGVIISADGYVITNNHVVGQHVREITIALPDKREIKGKLVGTDPTTDIALLKIPATGLPVLAWGDSSQLKVGEWVLAIGSPFQLSQTVTAGIVSATGRANMGFADYEDFIQTDAAINPGNSGGALINTRGELVGINTGIYSESGGYQGIGFAVPSKLARRVVDDLMQYGEVRRGSIGPLGIEKLTPQLADEAGVTATKGVIISRMTRVSEAYDAGLRPGDVVLSVNGQPIDDASQFLRLIADSKPGTTAAIKVLRGNKTMEFKLPIVSTSTSTRTRG